MSTNHVGGNLLNTLALEEHDGDLNAHRVVSAATIYAVVNTSGSGNVTLDPGSITQIRGNVTLSDSKGFLGLVTVVQSSSTRSIAGNITISSGNISVVGNVTLSDSKTFIGLVTAVSQNAGTNKTLLPVTVGLGNNSLSTIAVPTNANTIKVTNIMLSSNATTEIVIKSGVSYLYGNASIGVTLFPGGGFVMRGSADSPSILGMPSGSLNLEKRDSGGIVSKVSGGIIYFQE